MDQVRSELALANAQELINVNYADCQKKKKTHAYFRKLTKSVI
jgi:hypothetical protein